jgi:hypothetical protein
MADGKDGALKAARNSCKSWIHGVQAVRLCAAQVYVNRSDE